MRHRIELRHLQTLRALRDAGSLAEAANVLALTQSALSHQLRELEQRLDVAVIVRKSRPLRLTPAGEILADLADEVLPRVEQAEQALARMAGGEAGRLNMVVECHSCFNWLMPVLNAYREHWPEVEMDLSNAFHFDALPALLRGDVDLVVTADPDTSLALAYAPLFRYESVLVLAPDHPLMKVPQITAERLAEETLISYPVSKEKLDVYRLFMAPAGTWFREVRQTELTLMMLQLVASKRGVAVLPNWAVADFAAQNLVATRSLRKGGIWNTLYAAIRPEAQALPYMAHFIERARTTCFETLKGIAPVPE